MTASFKQSPMLMAALEYAARGWHVFPVPTGEKRSHKSAARSGGRKWGATIDPDEIAADRQQWPQANVGIVTGPKSGLFVVEADTLAGHGVDGIANLLALIEQNGQLPDTIEALSPSGSWHIYFQWPEGRSIRNSAGQVAPGVDVRGDGGMVIAVPSVKSGNDKPYQWKNPLGKFELAACPEWLLNLCFKPEPKLSERPVPHNAGGGWANAAMRGELAEVLAAPEGQRNDALNRAAFSLGQVVAGGRLSESTVTARLTAAASGIGLDPGEAHGTIKSGLEAGLQQPRGPADAAPVEARSFDELLSAARELTTDDMDKVEELIAEAATLTPVRRDQVLRAIKDATNIPMGTLREQIRSDVATDEPDHLVLARAALDRIGRDNIICATAFVWQWSSLGLWRQMDDRAIKQAIQSMIADQQVDVTSNRVNGVVDVLKSEIFKPDHVFNLGNPESVNCRTGEIELENGKWKLAPHCRENYRTTQIPVVFDPKANAPMFRAFLDQVFRDDDDRADKIKAMLELMGYTLMSHARHEKFIMLIGSGANGKSILLAVLMALVGTQNVAGVQPANFDNRFQRAHLHQKLANIVTELRQGEVIADAELKAITSGEPATVEHKHKDPFVMRPFATCWFGTNHMPHTRDFSEALFRRAMILTFNRTFAPDEQDKTLKDKLILELSGILSICLAAYADALVHGFTQPKSSEAAKKEWRLEADQVAQFVEDCCETATGAQARVGDIFNAYRSWATLNGISKTVAQKGLRDRLTRLGFGSDRDMAARYVTGLRLVHQSMAA